MLAKLLKHKFNAQRGLFTVLSLAAIGAGIVGSLMLWLLMTLSDINTDSAGSVLAATFSGILLAGVIFAIIAYYTAVVIVLYYRFYKQHFTDEGYLTFTLPVTTHQHLLSSMLNILLWMLICGLVVLLCAAIILLPMLLRTGASAWREFWQIVQELFTFMGDGYGFAQLLSVLGNTAYSLMLPIAAITIGSLIAKKHKLLTAFGIGYGISMVVSVLTGMLQIFTVAGDLALQEATQSFSLLLSTIIPALLYLVIAICGYIISHYLIDNKLNLA